MMEMTEDKIAEVVADTQAEQAKQEQVDSIVEALTKSTSKKDTSALKVKLVSALLNDPSHMGTTESATLDRIKGAGQFE